MDRAKNVTTLISIHVLVSLIQVWAIFLGNLDETFMQKFTEVSIGRPKKNNNNKNNGKCTVKNSDLITVKNGGTVKNSDLTTVKYKFSIPPPRKKNRK